MRRPESVEQLERLLAEQLYVVDHALALSIFLALKLRRPLFLEGEAGVGKTEVAKALAAGLGTDLIRLQCYEGLDVTHALYEWNYPRQLLEIRLLEASHELDGRKERTEHLFTEPFLIERPLLRALRHPPGEVPVLLIDEIDRADEEFEGFLLELLSDYQVTIPELGTVTATEPPIVILTSNRTREVHDALKRRCLYFWIAHPDFDKEYRIILTRMPGTPQRLTEQVTAFVQELRGADLHKMAGVSETLDWIAALVALEQGQLDEAVVEDTLGILLKDHDDIETMRGDRLRALVADAKARAAAPRA
ncbi:MAG TPA: MoxR family ATPase [Vicinamibacterales bacterium]|nr:MoxR family ATPase [Vicinamibacterales bacterium]